MNILKDLLLITEGYYDVMARKHLDFPTFIEDESGNVYFYVGHNHKGAKYVTDRSGSGNDEWDQFFHSPHQIENHGFKIHLPAKDAEWKDLDQRTYEAYVSDGPDDEPDDEPTGKDKK